MSAAIINKFMDMMGLGNQEDEEFDEEVTEYSMEQETEEQDEDYRKDKPRRICIRNRI